MITKFLERADGRIVIEIKTKSTYNYPCFDYDAWYFIDTLTNENSIQPGNIVAVALQTNIIRNERVRVILTSETEFINEGFGGNMNPRVRRFHGWRGTTDDISFMAYGVRKVESVISRSMAKNNWKLRIILGRDLKKREE